VAIRMVSHSGNSRLTSARAKTEPSKVLPPFRFSCRWLVQNLLNYLATTKKTEGVRYKSIAKVLTPTCACILLFVHLFLVFFTLSYDNCLSSYYHLTQRSLFQVRVF
jgi:hypothetical protein